MIGLAMVLAGCGNDTGGTVASDGSTTSPEPTDATATTTAPEATSAPASSAGGAMATAPATRPATTAPKPTTPTTTAPSASEAPLGRVVLGEADSGRRVVIDGNSRVELRLPENGGWETPKVDGTSVELVPVNSFASTGNLTWELARRHAGTTVFSVPAPSANRTFRLTVEVL
ncbi:MAG: hypothetical protein ACR2MO_00545 [Acidimicrobiales bacterium]